MPGSEGLAVHNKQWLVFVLFACFGEDCVLLTQFLARSAIVSKKIRMVGREKG